MWDKSWRPASPSRGFSQRMNGESNPVALVTGASKGIGRALVEHLLGRGCQVVGCSRGDAGWEAKGFLHLQADVSDEPQVKSLFREIKRRYDRLDAAINNAAVASMNHFLLTPAASIEKMLSTNVVGTFLVSREAAKLMRKRQYGRIVNFSSLAVPMRLAGQSAYTASKASVENLSQVMARELAEYGITVNVIGPSPTETDMTRGVPKDKIEQLIDSMVVRRLGTFTDVANVLDFFLRRESEAVTGQVIYLGGIPNG